MRVIMPVSGRRGVGLHRVCSFAKPPPRADRPTDHRRVMPARRHEFHVGRHSLATVLYRGVSHTDAYVTRANDAIAFCRCTQKSGRRAGFHRMLGIRESTCRALSGVPHESIALKFRSTGGYHYVHLSSSSY